MNPEYTFKACCRCNHISKNGRDGLKSLCDAHFFELNADLNVARNINIEHLDYRYILESQGVSVNYPHG
jgi:putative transposase